jgi:triosephosphate isomerase
MYKTAAETLPSPSLQTLGCECVPRGGVICPPYVNLRGAVEAVRGTAIEIGGQDLLWLREGAYTGEFPSMLAAVGCRW